MDAPIYEDDLTTIHGRHAALLVRLRDRTAADVIALSTAVTEEKLQAALEDLNDVATIIDDMFVDGEIEDPDIPFGELRLAWIGGEFPQFPKVHNLSNQSSMANNDFK